ncbi:MAG: glycosyltransferase [Candidatus Omnitrophica bacterium]|nr:glycosyltransferase [Candidatus Omnitrophota bacterium]
MNKSILIVTSTFPRDKSDIMTARFVLDLALRLKTYYKVYIVAPHSPGARVKEDLEGVTVRRFRYFFPESLEVISSGVGMLNDIRKYPWSVLLLPFYFISEFLAVISLARRENIRLINSHWLVPQGLISAFVSMTTGIKHVSTTHAADIFFLKRLGSAGRILAKFIAAHTDMVLAVSNYLRSELVNLSGSFDEKAPEVIPMGVDTSRFRPGNDRPGARAKLGLEERFTFLFVGKFVEKKGIKDIVSAVEVLTGRKKDFRVVLAGGGPLEDIIKKAVKDKRLEEYFKFAGWVAQADLPRYYAASDALLVPSVFDRKGETEGMPVVVAEAMAGGVPVIGSDISGIPDIVKDGVNGWLFDPGDFKALAGKMEEALSMPGLEVFGKMAVETSRMCSTEEVARRYRDRFEEVGSIASGGARHVFTMNIHSRIEVNVRSRDAHYAEHFRKEFDPAMRGKGAPGSLRINVIVDAGFPEKREKDILREGVFKKIYPYKFLIRGIDCRDIDVYFNTPLCARVFFPSMSAVFLQTEIVEPLVYYAALRTGLLMIHASAVAGAGGGYIFTAVSGAGKTTLAFNLVRDGYSFLGDDLVFLGEDRKVYSYPKRVHFFSYLKGKNPFLTVPPWMMLRAKIRHIARTALELTTGMKFYLSTRVGIKEIIPGAVIRAYADIAGIFGLGTGGSRDPYRRMMETCDTRQSLMDNIVGERKDLLAGIEERETAFAGYLSGTFKFRELAVTDIQKDIPRIKKMVEGIC